MKVGAVCIAGALALTAITARADPQPAASADTVIAYSPDFFAGQRPNTALDMVNELPGFSLDTGGGARGFGAAGNVLIDGERPATKNDTLDEILRRIPAGSVARIDLIRGGAPGIDMQGRTVIANIIRKSDEGLKLTTAWQETALFNGKFDYDLRVEGSKRSGAMSFEGGLFVGNNADDGTGNGPRTVSDAAGDVTRSGVERYFGEQGLDKLTGAVETPLAGGKVRMEGSYVHQPYVSLRDDAMTGPVGHDLELYHLTQDTGEVGVRYDRAFGANSSVEVYALQQLSRYALDDDFNSEGELSTFGLFKRGGESILRGSWRFAPTGDLSVESGLEGDYNWQTIRTDETDAGQPIPVPAANVLVRESRGEAFADATWTPQPTLSVEFAARVEASRISSTGDVTSSDVFVFAKPRAVVTWSPDPKNQLQLRLEREVDQLDFTDFAASGTLATGVHAGNPQLTPPQDWVIEGTWDRRFWEGGDLSVTLRRFWLSDVIDRAPFCAVPLAPNAACDPNDTYDAPANIGAGSRAALIAGLTLPTDKLGLKNGQLIVRAAWRRSRVIDPSTHQPREQSGLHPVDAEAHFNQGLPKWKSHWGLDWFSAWRQTFYYFNEIDTQRLGTWVDAYFEYQPRPDLSLKFEADNIATHGLEYIRAFYLPYRDIKGGQLSSIDNRSPRFGPEFTFRLRKTFG
ncbi:MAG TPA: hypothetical protein VFE13_18800 [Caulobacteraceae bacterium]|nr:hypothetical protein [Caulobacteraceae bacterium]